ncbi:protein slit-like [Patiria miniata]|uniref:LRRNT domain-containing protein n=1 Tax=Patiria miniata TaxID=46514 RepID=A0A914AJ85_PATMI|nr:protein slit-like [Patiria miniata]
MSPGKRRTSPTIAAMGLVVMLQLLAMLTTAVAVNPTGQACDVCECKGPVVICTGRNLTELPRGIPNGTKALELGDNFLREIPYDGLLEFRSLVKINIANNLIKTPFKLPGSVRVIFLDVNRISEIQPGGFAG